jgi:hypothetical protein
MAKNCRSIGSERSIGKKEAGTFGYQILAGESVSFMSVSEGGLFEEDATGSGKV